MIEYKNLIQMHVNRPALIYKMNVGFKMLFVSVCVICFSNCYSQETLPKNLNEAILYFEKNWTKKELDVFKKKSESTAVTDLHFGTGLWIRNNWVRGNRDTTLTNYFHSLGIFNPDEISTIILTSLHRKLNNKSIKLDKKVEEYNSYRKEMEDCEKRVKETALHNYNKYKVGDYISIYMPVNEYKNAVVYECPNNSWRFKADKDLILNCQIVDKYFINDSSNVFFTVRISSMNRNDVQILMKSVKPGDNENLSLKGIKIE